MSKTEILEQLPKLTPDERYEIRLRLAELDADQWLDDDAPLTDEQKAMLDARLAEMEEHPERALPWEEVRAQLEARLPK